jgi:hypothetical protein
VKFRWLNGTYFDLFRRQRPGSQDEVFVVVGGGRIGCGLQGKICSIFELAVCVNYIWWVWSGHTASAAVATASAVSCLLGLRVARFNLASSPLRFKQLELRKKKNFECHHARISDGLKFMPQYRKYLRNTCVLFQT